MTSLGQVWYRPALILFSESQPTAIDQNAGTYNTMWVGNATTKIAVFTGSNRFTGDIDLVGIRGQRLEEEDRIALYNNGLGFNPFAGVTQATPNNFWFQYFAQNEF